MSEVKIACPCAGTPHAEGDTVVLRDKLGLQAGIAVQSLLINQLRAQDKPMDSAEVSGLLAEAYLLKGVESWTLVDAAGKPEAVNEDSIRSRLLSDFAIAEPIADVADGLYMEPVLLPLLRKLGISLPTTPTNGSTSATRKSRTRRARKSSPSIPASSVIPMPTRRSSTTTTQTASTEATSVAHAGGSSS